MVNLIFGYYFKKIGNKSAKIFNDSIFKRTLKNKLFLLNRKFFLLFKFFLLILFDC